jgi:hypothetical protein
MFFKGVNINFFREEKARRNKSGRAAQAKTEHDSALHGLWQDFGTHAAK